MGFLGDLTSSVAGPLIGGLFGSSGQSSANRTNIKLGREQMAFQERMSGTAYQRATKDMMAAGLNPMLAYSQGGASAPMGSMPQVQNVAGAGMASAAQGQGVTQGIQQVLQSKAQTEQMIAQTKQIESQTMEKDVNSAIRLQELANLRLTGGSLEEDIPNKRQENIKRVRENELGRETFSADVARRKAESILTQLEIPRSQAEADFYKGLGDLNPYLKMLVQALSGGASAKQILTKPKEIFRGNKVVPIERK